MPIYQYRGRNAYRMDKPVHGGDTRHLLLQVFWRVRA